MQTEVATMTISDEQIFDSIASLKGYLLRCHSYGNVHALDELVKRYKQTKTDLSNLKVPASMKPAIWTDPDMLHR